MVMTSTSALVLLWLVHGKGGGTFTTFTTSSYAHRPHRVEQTAENQCLEHEWGRKSGHVFELHFEIIISIKFLSNCV